MCYLGFGMGVPSLQAPFSNHLVVVVPSCVGAFPPLMRSLLVPTWAHDVSDAGSIMLKTRVVHSLE